MELGLANEADVGWLAGYVHTYGGSRLDEQNILF
jgi:hypothetical protein